MAIILSDDYSPFLMVSFAVKFEGTRITNLLLDNVAFGYIYPRIFVIKTIFILNKTREFHIYVKINSWSYLYRSYSK